MGTDISYVFQKKNPDNSWETLDLDQDFRKNEITGEYEDGEYYIGRYYLLFAVIAGVRNGYGFAGHYRHEPLVPIAEGRGLPNGIQSDWFKHEPSSAYGFPIENDSTEYLDLGEHSFNWLLGSEILDWFKEERKLTHVGCVTLSEYDEWRSKSDGSPNSYASHVLGDNFEVYDETEHGALPFNLVRVFRQYAKVTHVRISWNENLNDCLSNFKDMIQKLVDQHGEIRMVMGFDG